MPTVRRIVLLAIAAVLTVAVGQASATTIMVTVANDPAGASCPGANCSLRAAVAAANTGDVVDLGAGEYTITQGSPVTNTPGQSPTIEGVTARQTEIDASGNGANPAFSFSGNPTMDNVSIIGSNGGAILLSGGIALHRDAFTDNHAPNGGGALNITFGSATIDGSTFSNNTSGTLGGSGANGGALYNQSGNGSTGFTIANSTFSGNHAQGSGARGGAIDMLAGNVNLTNVTIAGNSADSGGGGISQEAGTINNHVNAVNLLLASNTSTTGGGNCGRTGSGDFVLGADTVVFGDQTDCTQNNATPNTQLTGDPHLGQLQGNGGPTDTMTIDATSSALDHGVAGGAAVDQRGVGRPQGSAKDVGAYELVQNGDLQIFVTLPAAANLGDPIHYQAQVLSNGPANDGAFSSELADVLPPNVNFMSMTTSQGVCTLAFSNIDCQLGFIPNGSFATVDITVTAVSGSQVNNHITTDSGRPDTNPANNGASLLTILTAPLGGSGGGGGGVGAPIVTSLGSATGAPGSVLTISGGGFAGATGVLFGGLAAPFVIDGFNRIHAIVPAGTGTVDVRVVNPGGTSATTSADRFTFATPPTTGGSAPSSRAPKALCTMPNLVGHTYGGSERKLARLGCALELFHRGHAAHPPSHVKSQSPAPGTPVHQGDRLSVVLG